MALLKYSKGDVLKAVLPSLDVPLSSTMLEHTICDQEQLLHEKVSCHGSHGKFKYFTKEYKAVIAK